ncbi:iron chaperone [Paenibacillus sp. NEAU-GSW1]|uniref:iron chaperone n=1 Tax=Paenibacillus sp. NEAU-GSW1 TaxID=2682486 RepID=UPI0012E0DA60|nr:DUF1801 domain-containing protein [Paenibacillus sp. NEAU-GSW1]MUT67174.1 hypothetical protein [Paenibacillus sp. NEAU-GSW1]
MENNSEFQSVDEYIACFPPEVQEVLRQLRTVIKEAAPGATEKISYQMPAFVFHGNLVYFAAYRKHIGFYPTSCGVHPFMDELTDYKVSKGTIQFPLGKPIPFDLISRIVRYRVEENIEIAKGRSRKNS